MSMFRQPSAYDAIVAPEQGIHDIIETSKHRLGTKYALGPRVFRYAKFGDTCTFAGGVYSSSVIKTDEHGLLEINTAAAKGDYTLEFILPGTAGITMAANVFDDGLMVIQDASTAARIGEAYTIKSHTTVAAATTGVVTLTLYQPLNGALADAQTIAIIPNPYSNCQLATRGDITAGWPLGAAQAAVGTANYFGWIQTAGPCGVVAGAALVEDTDIVLDTTTAGEVISVAIAITSQATAVVTPPPIGRTHYEPTANAKGAIAWLTLE